MDFQTWLTSYGLNTYRTTIFTPIPSTPEAKIALPKQMPENIGRIFGLSIYADTVTPTGSLLPTTTQAQNLYMTFKDAATDFYENIRLDDMLFNFAGVPTPSGIKFLWVNLPGQFDLSTSFFSNPTLIVSAAPPATPINIGLTLHYISTESNRRLLEAGIILDEVISRKKKQ